MSSPDPDPSSPVISFANNNIRDRRPFHPGRTGISSTRITLSHIRGCKPLSEHLNEQTSHCSRFTIPHNTITAFVSNTKRKFV